jgi:hypothetical protein
MSTINDVVFTVKGKIVSMPGALHKSLPPDVRVEAIRRMRILGSAVAGFTGQPGKIPPTLVRYVGP